MIKTIIPALASLMLLVSSSARAGASTNPLTLVGAQVILHQVLAQNLLGDAKESALVNNTLNGTGAPNNTIVYSMTNGKDGGLGTFYYDIQIGSYDYDVSPPKYTPASTIEVGITNASGTVESATTLTGAF